MLKMRKRGFTLVEIMIVVAIIGILIAIAVPGFIRARNQSQGMACSENLAKIDGAKEQWALENNQPGGTAIALQTLVDNGYMKQLPSCPASGTYSVAGVSSNTTCDEYVGTAPKLHTLPGTGGQE